MSVQYSSRGRSKSLTPASSGGLQQPVNHLLGSRTGRRCTGRRANYAGARVLLGCGGMRAGVDLINCANRRRGGESRSDPGLCKIDQKKTAVRSLRNRDRQRIAGSGALQAAPFYGNPLPVPIMSAEYPPPHPAIRSFPTLQKDFQPHSREVSGPRGGTVNRFNAVGVMARKSRTQWVVGRSARVYLNARPIMRGSRMPPARPIIANNKHMLRIRRTVVASPG
jgi:hypothetical protein